MLCEICVAQAHKYKCPKCGIRYCSIGCFRSESHNHEATAEVQNSRQTDKQEEGTVDEFEKVLQDGLIKKMLGYRALHFHLSVVMRIMKDTSFSGEGTEEARRELANMKLTALRSGGVEENELAEEFCSRVIELLQE